MLCGFYLINLFMFNIFSYVDFKMLYLLTVIL